MTVPTSDLLRDVSDAMLERLAIDGGCRISSEQAKVALAGRSRTTAKTSVRWSAWQTWATCMATAIAAIALALVIYDRAEPAPTNPVEGVSTEVASN